MKNAEGFKFMKGGANKNNGKFGPPHPPHNSGHHGSQGFTRGGNNNANQNSHSGSGFNPHQTDNQNGVYKKKHDDSAAH